MIKAKKSLGQNFLIDNNIIDQCTITAQEDLQKFQSISTSAQKAMTNCYYLARADLGQFELPS